MASPSKFHHASGGIKEVKVRKSTDHISTKNGDPYDGKYEVTCICLNDPWIDKSCTHLSYIIAGYETEVICDFGDPMEMIKACIERIEFEDGQANIYLKRDLRTLNMRCKASNDHFNVSIYLDKFKSIPPIGGERRAYIFYEG